MVGAAAGRSGDAGNHRDAAVETALQLPCEKIQ
jgi:hypothetical protein